MPLGHKALQELGHDGPHLPAGINPPSLNHKSHQLRRDATPPAQSLGDDMEGPLDPSNGLGLSTLLGGCGLLGLLRGGCLLRGGFGLGEDGDRHFDGLVDKCRPTDGADEEMIRQDGGDVEHVSHDTL